MSSSPQRVKSRRRKPVPEGIRITKVGLWYVLFTVVVAIAATNTGNNALYMVLAVMLALLVVSGLFSRQNVRRFEVTLEPPGEIFANRPFLLHFQVTSRAHLLPRWFVLFSVERLSRPLLVPYLSRRDTSRGSFEVILPRRGRHTVRSVHVSSLFPFGFFRKGIRLPVELEMLVFPEIFSAASSRLEGWGAHGEEPTRLRGRGHDLHSLRGFRQGDDPRGIHWKQTARTGEMIFMEREAEASRRLSILLDNGTGELTEQEMAERFERLVSEAATAAVDYLGRGFEVELVTRDEQIPFGRGPRQRLRLLEQLALVESRPRSGHALTGTDPTAPELRLGLERDPAALSQTAREVSA